jgi:hypothetical protein
MLLEGSAALADSNEVDFGSVVDRLGRKFLCVPRKQLEAAVESVAVRFHDARVRVFVPLLVEHEATVLLRERQSRARDLRRLGTHY